MLTTLINILIVAINISINNSLSGEIQKLYITVFNLVLIIGMCN